MPQRARGAAYLLLALLVGRLLDGFDLPFEAPDPERTPRPDSMTIVPNEPPSFSSTPSAASESRTQDTTSSDSKFQEPVDINRASVAELVQLPGVGPVLADRIVDFRETHGPLRSLADLRRVQGIGARTAARLEPRVRFD